MFLSGFDGCLGGEDVWGFVWPNTENEETVVVACPDGQGNVLQMILLQILLVYICIYNSYVSVC